jgi:hypothetical protein
VADATPLLYVPPVPTYALLLIGPVTLLAACLLAVGPARVLSQLRLARVLHEE